MRGGSKDMPTISTILREYIAHRKRPVSCKELVQHVTERRTDLRSRDLGATVRSVLQRGKQFVRTARGAYTLKEW